VPVLCNCRHDAEAETQNCRSLARRVLVLLIEAVLLSYKKHRRDSCVPNHDHREQGRLDRQSATLGSNSLNRNLRRSLSRCRDCRMGRQAIRRTLGGRALHQRFAPNRIRLHRV
jgi:hypothetical protein